MQPPIYLRAQRGCFARPPIPAVNLAAFEFFDTELHHQHGPDALGPRAVTAWEGLAEKRAAFVGGGLHSRQDPVNNRARKVNDGKCRGNPGKTGWLP
jgi:hypothetical protein